MEEGTSAFKIVTGKPIGKGPLEKPRPRWEDNIIIYFKEIGVNTRNLLNSAQDRDYLRILVNEALNLRVPKAIDVITYHIVL